LGGLFQELRRRNIFRVAGVYAVVGWLLAQVAGTLENSIGLPAWFDGFVVATLLIGFPIAMLLAWAFEMTPEGVKPAGAMAEGASAAAKPVRALDYVIVGALVLVGALVIWQGTRPAPVPILRQAQDEGGNNIKPKPHPELVEGSKDANTETDPASIAVLPFADLSPNKDQEYFSDGMAEEILNVLVKVQGLSVSSRTSSFQFKGRELGIPEIANQLNVRHVLEGSVRKSGNTLRITAQLIDTTNDRHLWSDTFDRPLTAENIFEIQDEIAQAIVDALGESIAVLAKAKVEVVAPTDNLTAYDLFLKARPLYQARKDLDKADELLTRALEQDPQFAGAWEMRAALQSLMVDYNYASMPRDEVEQKTSEFAKRALAINPNSAIVTATLARIQADNALNLRSRGNFETILAGYDRALAINPHDASALNWRGLSYANLGYLDIALKDFTVCVEAEPYYTPCIGNQLLTLGSLGRDAEAVAEYKTRLRNGSAMIYFPPIGSFARQAEEVALLSAFNTPEMLFGWHRQGELYDALRQPETAHLELATDILNFTKNTGELQKFLGQTLAIRLGDSNRILVSAEFWDAGFKNYRQTDNFKAGIKQSGIFEYWRKNGFPPQCRALGDDDFECD
jgi:TolB-like protein/Tfp pilus assembly protein PilF